MHSFSKTKVAIMSRASAIAIISALSVGTIATLSLPALSAPVSVEAMQLPSFADTVAAVSPAVVSVRVKSRIQPAAFRGNGGQSFEDLPKNHPFRRFFDQRDFEDQKPDLRRGEGALRPTSQGSGFFISEDGFVVTNNHVIEDGEAFTIVMNDGTELDAELIGRDPKTDLAVLKVNEDQKFTYVELADSESVRVGDWAVAVGNPFGLGGTVTTGIVSARGRDIGSGPYDDFLQIDAAVNKGNSGGPTFNLNGQVIGVNTAIFSPSGGNVGIAFAIPASVVNDVVTELRQDGTVSRGYLGINIQAVTSDIAESLALAKAEGVLVASASDDTPAAKAGLKAGDIVLSVDGEAVNSPKDLSKLIASEDPGKTVALKLWRDGEETSINVTLGKLPAEARIASETPEGSRKDTALADTGLTLRPNPDGTGLLIVEVVPDSSAAEKGLTQGDVLIGANGNSVDSVEDLEAAISTAKKAGRKSLLLQAQRGDNSRFVAVPINQG